jgi:hypothetical protein
MRGIELEDTVMTDLAVGERVIIGFGQRQGQSGEIIEIQLAHVYKVLFEDGALL